MKTLLKRIGTILILLMIVVPECNSEIHKWKDASGTVHFSDKMPMSGAPSERVAVFDSKDGSGGSRVSISGYDFSISDMEMMWSFGSSKFGDEIRIQKIRFVVKNESNTPIENLRLQCIFIENGNQVFGEDVTYVEFIPAKMKSKEVELKLNRGFVHNDYTKLTLSQKTFDVEMFGSIGSGKSLIKKFEFIASGYY